MRFSRTSTKKRYSFHHRELECKLRSQEIPGIPGKFGCGVQNEAGHRLTEFCQENTLVIANTLFQHNEDSPHGHHPMVNTKIDYIF